MPNHLAFASVSATISYLLEEVNRDVPGIKITTKPLDAIDTQNPVNGLNLFLYYVAPTTSVDAVDTLVRDNNGKPSNNPVLSLDLHYIITSTSSENDDLVAQKILASAMRVLNNHPVLQKDHIRRAITNKEGLESSDLPDQLDDVRFTLAGLALEDITKIWSRFPNTNFRSSVAYVAQVVMLESKLIEPPGPIGFVKLGKVGQLKSPVVERIEPQILEYTPNASILITGNGLKAEATSVEFNDTIRVQPEQNAISEQRIAVKIPQGIEPGILKVRINHKLSSVEDGGTFGRQSVLSSNSSPLVVAPRIISPRQGRVARGKDFTIEFEPSVSGNRSINVHLGDTSFPVKGSGTAGDFRVNKVQLTIPPDFTAGMHLLRISIDGAMSLLVKDDDPHSPTLGKIIGPYIEAM